jgi:hypothetical protein
MKIILPILTFYFVTSCTNKCDCSYANYSRIKSNRTKEYISKVLNIYPTSEKEVLDEDKRFSFGIYRGEDTKLTETTYQCGENKIIIYYMNGLVKSKSFN